MNAKEINAKILEKVNAKIIEELENGRTPWRKPWTGDQQAARSHTSGKPYSFFNQLYIAMQGGQPGEYLTFAQGKKLGGKLRKGSKGFDIVFWQAAQFVKAKPEAVEDDENSESKEDDKTVWVKWQNAILKSFHVFNVNDFEGIEPKYSTPTPTMTKLVGEELTASAEMAASDYLSREGIGFSNGGDRAFYRPLTDEVKIPEKKNFTSEAEYYSTLFHELTHSTGSPKRFHRFEAGERASREEYSREELVAEIGAAYCLATIGIDDEDTTKNSGAYLRGWIQVVKDDPRAFIVAAGKAEKAAKFIFSK